MIVENYSAAGKKTGSKTVAMELEICLADFTVEAIIIISCSDRLIQMTAMKKK